MGVPGPGAENPTDMWARPAGIITRQARHRASQADWPWVVAAACLRAAGQAAGPEAGVGAITERAGCGQLGRTGAPCLGAGLSVWGHQLWMIGGCRRAGSVSGRQCHKDRTGRLRDRLIERPGSGNCDSCFCSIPALGMSAMHAMYNRTPRSSKLAEGAGRYVRLQVVVPGGRGAQI
jgi:hypothetical protein